MLDLFNFQDPSCYSDWKCEIKHPYDCSTPYEDSDHILSMDPNNVLKIDTDKNSNAFAEFCVNCKNSKGEVANDEKHRVYVRDDCQDATQLEEVVPRV